MQQTDPLPQVTAYIRSMLDVADVIGWNECGTGPIREVIRKLPAFDSYVPTGGAAGHIPISWRRERFKMLRADTAQIHPGVEGITPSRHVNRVLLEDLESGQQVVRINTHVPHHIEEGGMPRVHDLIPGQNERGRLCFDMLRIEFTKAKAFAPVILGGDFNVDLFAEMRRTRETRCPWFPLSTFESIGRIVIPKSGTHGKRAIDWTILGGPITVVTDSVLPLGSSDHHPFLTTLLITEGAAAA